LRILLAEDNAVNQLLASRMLEKRGHHVVIVGNGQAALEQLEFETFDLILMDIQMPGIDGFEATARIRRMEATTGTHLPIVAMTAHAMEGDRERCLAAGMDGYIAKPIRAEDLVDAIEKLGHPPAVTGVESTPRPREREPIDTASALARVGGDAELLKEMVVLFLNELPTLLTNLRDAVTGADAKAAERAAHKLKGSAGNFAAHPAVEALRKLETLCRYGGLSTAGPVFADVEREIQRLKSAMANLSGQEVSS
jgi:CheY-like chemotaxis protein